MKKLGDVPIVDVPEHIKLAWQDLFPVILSCKQAAPVGQQAEPWLHAQKARVQKAPKGAKTPSEMDELGPTVTEIEYATERAVKRGYPQVPVPLLWGGTSKREAWAGQLQLQLELT